MSLSIIKDILWFNLLVQNSGSSYYLRDILPYTTYHHRPVNQSQGLSSGDLKGTRFITANYVAD
jgi:hypothetical protein